MKFNFWQTLQFISFSYVCLMKTFTDPIYLEKEYDLFQIFNWLFAWFDLNQVCHLHPSRDFIDVCRTICQCIYFTLIHWFFLIYLHSFLCSCLSPHSPTKSEFIRAKYQMLAFVHKLPCRDDDGVTTKDLSKVRPPKGITSDS